MRERILAVWQRVRASTTGGGTHDAELDEELGFHLEMLTRRNVARGMSPDAARREAQLTFGGVDRFREESWDVQRSRWLEDFWHDARHAVRMLRRTPAFSMAALLTLALGIGASTAIFSVYDAVLLQPLPYAEPERLVSFHARYENYRDWTEAARSLDASGTYTYSIANVTSGAEPARVWTLAVTASLLPTLGVEPFLGQNFTAEDDRHPAAPRVLLRHGFWQTQFGGDAGIVGRTIEVNGVAHEVIGVLPPDLEFPPPARRADGAMPIIADLWTGAGWVPDMNERGALHVIARLAVNHTPVSASAELERMANANRGESDRISVPVVRVDESVLAPLRPALSAFIAGIGLVLLVACANLGSMLLARFNGRAREIAVRTSLGARRGRILRQVLAEGVVLAVAGSAAALAVAFLLLRVFLRFAPAELARVQNAGLNPRVLLVTLFLGAVTAAVISILPAWSAIRRTPRSALSAARGSTIDRGTLRAQSVLVACEVAFAVVLLVGGGLLVRSFIALSKVDPGFASERIVTADVLVPADRYPAPLDVLHFFDRLEEGLGARPGVTSVSAIDRLPYGTSFSGIEFRIAGRPDVKDARPRAWNTAARPGYFRTMGIPMVHGREFTQADHAESPLVVVIGKVLADRYWPGQNPVGQRVVVWGIEREIVGVAGDVRHFGPTQPVDPLLYLPQAQDITTRRMMTIVLQTTLSPDLLLGTLRSEIRALDAQLPVSNLRTFDALRSERTAGQRFDAMLAASFAALAVLLAAVGIYGVMSYTVTQRTREIAVRIALGASRLAVLLHFIRRAFKVVAAGLAIGIASAVPLTRLLESMLFGVGAADFATYAIVALVVCALALLAAWIPAWRAARVQPVAALAAE